MLTRARQAASMSPDRISASPTSTASTPARSSSARSEAVRRPDSATTVTPSGTPRQQLERPPDVDLQRRQVAVVDPDQPGAERRGALELGLVVNLDQRREPEPRAVSCSRSSSALVERGHDQQDRVGARRQRLVELVGVDDEVLAQDRQRRSRARRPQIVERSAEARPLGEDRQRCRAAALVAADDVLEPQVRSDHAGGWRAPLVLGDHRQPRLGERLRERTQLVLAPGRRALELGVGHAIAPPWRPPRGWTR